ncbi:ATP-binding protein [Alkaliphilus peptidifermentans]|uniref:AAA-like domain-containing protein n=1 Tax=Alkaliphilus peptidifermentans DSM 18978 TaxID=1120976 RepID=A0A1G5EBH4_9FIRM|nr:ATP-binding protein [Alkaliphilus peptidifermentans]SCY24111.1 AAA-like domain-containing protein [Alkaliphilus peptidifermentans DSM 18978]
MNEIKEYSSNSVSLPRYESLDMQFRDALQVVNDIVLKNYITKLRELEVVPLDEQELKSNIAENVRFFKITEMVYEKDEYSTYKFASVFNALSTTNCAVFIIIDSNGEKTDFYLGIRSLDSERTTNSLKDTLKNAMFGQFPGIKTQEFLEDEMHDILGRIKANSISAVSCVANSRDEENKANKSFVQGLEKLALSMQGERYTAIIVANGTTQEQLMETRKNYEKIYTHLSPFANSQISYSNNNTINLAQSFTEGLTKGSSYTKNQSSTYSSSESRSDSVSNSISKEGMGSKTTKGLASAVGIVSAALAPITGGASLAIGGVVSGGLGLLGTALQNTETHSTSSSTSFSESKSETSGESYGENESRNEGTTDTKGIASGTSQSIALTMQDKTIINTLERIDTQLERLKEFESLGMWECAAYFLSENSYAAEIAASTYKALMRGENSGVEVSAINSWGKVDGIKTNLIKQYVTNFAHPIFSYNSTAGSIQVTPCALVSGNELALHMGLPRRSVCGFPVIEHADFGKEVVSYNGVKATHTINLGKVFNMGSDCSNRVRLNRNSLSMHTFITGSTGSGKSNTVYELLDQLDTVGINFLIIEPAKGEYKNIFGNRRDVVVFGTNPLYSDLLRINPFKFPPKIHILEHIDRLIEIFSVCWPMYAAMPAVLKDAVLQAYEVCGWDLVESKNKYSDDLFPTFQDLQIELINVIDNSAYSQELKSNYIGSLATRVKSLTNGLNGQIFSADEVDNNVLFDKNVIVDLSRVGSLETKSLIMGILVMRLNEHRMAFTEGMNQTLKHVTVLEEAHHILKRTSNDQNPEGSNVAGKSVEMLSNAIAEMRTYGEGFIIADQSPSAVDISAIRNTNTKIIMRLPDESDRRLAGKSAALKDEQLDEIAKLPRGVAVVYQNDWLEPVLCRINKFDGKEIPYEYARSLEHTKEDHNIFVNELLKLLLKGRVIEKIDVDIDKLNKLLGKANITTKNKIGVHFLLREYLNTGELTVWKNEHFDKLAELVTELLDCKVIVENLVQRVENFKLLTDELYDIVRKHTIGLTNEIIIAICHCLLKDYSKQGGDKLEIYAAWRKEIDNGGLLI